MLKKCNKKQTNELLETAFKVEVEAKTETFSEETSEGVATRNRKASTAATTTVSMSTDAQTELVIEGLRNNPESAADVRLPFPACFLPETMTCCR